MELFEDLLQKTYKEVELEMGIPYNSFSSEEWVYVLETYCMGLLKKKLYLYFRKGVVCDYYVGIL